MSEIKPDVAEKLDYLRSVPSGYVTDTFSRLGLNGWITGLRPSKPFNGNHVAGPAATIQFAPVRGKKRSKYSTYAILREVAPGSVVVISSGGCEGVLVGGNVCTAASVAGVEAILFDGSIRDLEDIRELDMPVLYGKATITREFTFEIVSVNEPVIVGGASIHAGDYVVADEDGGAVIPPDYLDEVVENVRDVARLEEEQAEVIKTNGSLDELKKILVAKKSPTTSKSGG